MLNEKNRIIYNTKDHEGGGFQILSAHKFEDDKKDAVVSENSVPIGGDVIIGFVFRIFVIIFLFLYGIRIIVLDNETTSNFEIWWLFRLIGVVLVFLSLYLLFNFFAKKINRESYIKWCVGFVMMLVVIALGIFSGNYVLLDTILLVFR